MKTIQTSLVTVLVVLLVSFITSCGDEDTSSNNGPKPPVFVAVTDILDVAREGIIGETLTLSARVAPEGATNKALTWSLKSAGDTGAQLNGDKLSATGIGNVTVTATVAKGTSEGDFTKDFNIPFDVYNALRKTFDISYRDGVGENLILGNSLAWIKDAKEGSEVWFYFSTTVYPSTSTVSTHVPKPGDTIGIIGNSSDNQLLVKVPEDTTPGTGRSVLVKVPRDQAFSLIGNASSLKVEVLYGRINICDLMEPRRYKVPFAPNTQRLMNYFRDIYGEKMVSGMMDVAWEDSTTPSTGQRNFRQIGDQMLIVKTFTDYYPAIKGFDWLEIKRGALDNQQAEEAMWWWKGYDRQNRQYVKVSEKPGIVKFCWHWRGDASMRPSGVNENGYYDQSSNDNSPRTLLRVPMEDGKLKKDHPFFTYIKSDLDIVINKFKWMNEQAGEDIPILWRPLHEAGGNMGRGPWFWWAFATDNNTTGEFSFDGFKALWEYMYDYMTIVHGLNNLIWTCNPQGDAMNNWVPDLKTVDITGYDPYVGDHNSQKNFYDSCKAMDPTGPTMVAMTENGRIPDPDLCVADNALWLFFVIWDGMMNQNLPSGGSGNYPGPYTFGTPLEESAAYKFYRHERVVTLESLPDIRTYGN